MNITKVRWNQHTNPRMRVRDDDRYWVIAEPTTWDAESSHEHAARIFYGTFPIRLKELGMAWGDTMDQALTNAIEILERHLPTIEARLSQEAGNAIAGSSASYNHGTDRARRMFAEEWRL